MTETAELMLDMLQSYRKQNRFSLHAFVIMSDHLHLLITPAFDISLEKAVQFIKGGFSFRLKSKREVWERSFNEVQIKSADKFHACRRYIEENPVRAHLVTSAEMYPYSSAQANSEIDPIPDHFLVERGRG